MVDSVNVGDKPDGSDGKSQEELDHEAAMIAKADEGVSGIRSVDSRTGENVDLKSADADGEEPAGEAKAERPDDVPEKFWDAEKGEVNVKALLKAQADAESALRQAQSGKPKGDETPPEGDGEEADDPKDESQEDAVSKAETEFAEKGELSDETYEALAKTGLSREVVDGYIAGQTAIAEKLADAAYSPFEGEEGYSKATAWATENLTEEEIQELNVQLTSTTPSIVAAGAKALAARYAAEADVSPGRRVEGDANADTTGGYFKSSQEMQKAMADPRYQRDEAYRQQVIQKIDRADKAGVNLF